MQLQPNSPSNHPARVVALAGGHNFRDIGGYPTADGRTVAWGRVFRSGTMVALSDADHLHLNTLGLRVICDLRSTRERDRRPSRLPSDASFEVWFREHETSTADLVTHLHAPDANAADTRQRIIALYPDLAYEQVPSYRELFARLAYGELPLLFHCAAGKDRTGIAAAILLDILGVSREIIREDYAFTDLFFERGCKMMLEDPAGEGLHDLDPQIWAPMMRADPAYLDAVFTTLEQRHGSSAGFLHDEIGLDADGIEAIRERLLV